MKVYRQVASLVTATDAPMAFSGRGTADVERSSRAGLVYIVGLGGLVKIGYTTNLKQRMRSIPHDEVLATFPGTMHDEKRLHRQFAKHRLVGEWFTRCPEIESFAASH